jgi:hypothetical protein
LLKGANFTVEAGAKAQKGWHLFFQGMRSSSAGNEGTIDGAFCQRDIMSNQRSFNEYFAILRVVSKRRIRRESSLFFSK